MIKRYGLLRLLFFLYLRHFYLRDGKMPLKHHEHQARYYKRIVDRVTKLRELLRKELNIEWNATNDFGTPVSAGIYFYQIQAKEFVKTRKMVLLK